MGERMREKKDRAYRRVPLANYLHEQMVELQMESIRQDMRNIELLIKKKISDSDWNRTMRKIAEDKGLTTLQAWMKKDEI